MEGRRIGQAVGGLGRVGIHSLTHQSLSTACGPGPLVIKVVPQRSFHSYEETVTDQQVQRGAADW